MGRLTGTLYTLGDRDGSYDLLGPVVQRRASVCRGGTLARESRDSRASVRRGGTLGQRQRPVARESRDVWATGPLGHWASLELLSPGRTL
jgi:hypothetical protein